MATCDSCGNNYDKVMRIEYGNSTYNFDSFECAIHKLAPECTACGLKIIGHGVESDGRMFCCAHCAREEGMKGLTDRRDQGTSTSDSNPAVHAHA